MDRCRMLIMCLGLLICTGCLLAGRAAAQDVTSKDADACEGDVHRLCQTYFPEAARVAQCLVDRRAELSPACAQALARPRDIAK